MRLMTHSMPARRQEHSKTLATFPPHGSQRMPLTGQLRTQRRLSSRTLYFQTITT